MNPQSAGASATVGRQRGGLTLERESTLRSRLIARDESALVELIDLTSPWLLGLAQSLLADAAEAEEVVLDTFRIGWQKIGTLPADEDSRLLPWLFRITRNRAIDRLRARRRHRVKQDRIRVMDDGGDAVPPVEPDESARPGWHVHDQVQSALGELPAEQLAAVRLAYFQGFSQSEIAERLDIPLGTVKTRLRLAFARLRTALAPLKEWVS